MLTRISVNDIELPKIFKKVEGKSMDNRNAFAVGSVIEFTVEVPRRLGASAVVLRIFKDGGAYTDYPLDFTELRLGVDVYRTELDTQKLCGSFDEGLFYYDFSIT